MAGQISSRCSSMISSWRKRAYMQPEACSWQRLQRRAGRAFARDARNPMRTCFIEFGNAEPTQVRSLTRHRHLGQKATQAKDTEECFWLGGGCATILDFARHEVGFLASIWEWRIDRSLLIHLWGRLGNAQRSANQARGVVRGHYSGYVKLSWANPGYLETAQ